MLGLLLVDEAPSTAAAGKSAASPFSLAKRGPSVVATAAPVDELTAARERLGSRSAVGEAMAVAEAEASENSGTTAEVTDVAEGEATIGGAVGGGGVTSETNDVTTGADIAADLC